VAALRSRGERGAGAVQMLILLIAPVAVAGTFAAAVLNAGDLATNQFQNTTLAALRGSGLELRSAVSLRTDGHSIKQVVLDVVITAGSDPVNLDPGAVKDATDIAFIDDANALHGLRYSVTWLNANGNTLLEDRETAELSIDVSGIQMSGENFTIEVRPSGGTYLNIRRPRPSGSELAPVIELY
jgi:archaellin